MCIAKLPAQTSHGDKGKVTKLIHLNNSNHISVMLTVLLES